MIDTSIMADDTEYRISNKVGAVGDGGVDVAGMGEADKRGTHTTIGDLRDAEATLMVEGVPDEHGVSLELGRVRRQGQGDDSPIPRLDQGFTTKVVKGTPVPVSVSLHDSSARWQEGVGVARVGGHGGGGEGWSMREV